jgi:CBS domain-containing protein
MSASCNWGSRLWNHFFVDFDSRYRYLSKLSSARGAGSQHRGDAFGSGLSILRTEQMFAELLPPPEYSSAAKLWRPSAAQLRRVALSDPAEYVVTDFTRESPLTVTEECLIDDALRDMVIAEVHALVVVRGDRVSGLITSYDIQGERPLHLLLSSPGRAPRDQIEVRHIMTPWKRVPKIDWSSIGTARVQDITSAFRSTSATHLVVVENVERNTEFVRALISRRRLNRQLGRD